MFLLFKNLTEARADSMVVMMTKDDDSDDDEYECRSCLVLRPGGCGSCSIYGGIGVIILVVV